jgi:hypothetical protein
MQFVFGDPYYNEHTDQFQADVIRVEREQDDIDDWETQEVEQKLDTRAVATEAIIEKLYSALYDDKDIEIHINRVKGSLMRMISSVTYRELVEMKIINIDDIK